METDFQNAVLSPIFRDPISERRQRRRLGSERALTIINVVVSGAKLGRYFFECAFKYVHYHSYTAGHMGSTTHRPYLLIQFHPRRSEKLHHADGNQGGVDHFKFPKLLNQILSIR